MWLAIQIRIAKIWCALSGADAVYVKDLSDNEIMIKVMRNRLDPFDDTNDKLVKLRPYGYRKCHPDGKVGSTDNWIWRYVDEDLNIKHRLSN